MNKNVKLEWSYSSNLSFIIFYFSLFDRRIFKLHNTICCFFSRVLVIFLIATKQPVKQIRRRTRNSYCASGNPIFSRSFLPLHYRELRVCHRLPEAEAARDGSSSCLIPYPVLYRLDSSRIHNEPHNFIEFAAGRAAFHGQLWRPTLSSPSALYSAILNLPTYNSHTLLPEKGKRSTRVVPYASTFVLWSMLADFLHFEQTEYFPPFSPSLFFFFSIFAYSCRLLWHNCWSSLWSFLFLWARIWENEMFGASSASLDSFRQEMLYNSFR